VATVKGQAFEKEKAHCNMRIEYSPFSPSEHGTPLALSPPYPSVEIPRAKTPGLQRTVPRNVPVSAYGFYSEDHMIWRQRYT
jgi:hypothetical protein